MAKQAHWIGFKLEVKLQIIRTNDNNNLIKKTKEFTFWKI